MSKKKKCDEIRAAADVLGLPERASMAAIRKAYREMILKWHPDKCKDDPEKCKEKSREVIEAYSIIVDYCSSYKYPFSKEELEQDLSPEEWWFQRFGNDPIWGRGPIDED